MSQTTTSRPESPFKSIKSAVSKKQSSFNVREQPPTTRPSTSPPCTCDEDEEEDEDDHDHVRPTSTRPTSRAVKGLLASEVPPPWDQRSRDSRMSRATTTRTAASANAFSSLASSAFQMPDNVFIDNGTGRPDTLEVVHAETAHAAVTLASDAISLEALSPRPFRSRSRTRSRAASHRYMIKEQQHAGGGGREVGHGSGGLRRSTSRPPDYHYHHELDRCRSFREGGLDDHIEFCKCTCDDRVTDYDEFIINETKVGLFLFQISISYMHYS